MSEKKLTGYPSIDKPWLKYYVKEAIHAPLPEDTVYGYMHSQNCEYPDNIALHYYGQKDTYDCLFRQIEKAAKAFAQAGVREGDIVSFCMPTTPETIFAFYALNKLGAVANMIDPRTNAEKIKSYLQSAHSSVLVMIDLCYPKIEKILKETEVQTVVVVSVANSMPAFMKFGYYLTAGRKTERIPKSLQFIIWNDFIKNGTHYTGSTSVCYKPDMPAAIVYTGGTTGTPKGAVISNDNFNTMVFYQMHSRTRMERGHRFLDIMPPFIAYGLVCGIANPLALGLEIVIIPKFVPEQFGDLIIKYKPQHVLGVPSFWEGLTASKRVKHADLSFLENVITGGDRIAPSSEKHINDFLASHGYKYKLSKGYGMTELSSTATYTVCDACNLPDSVGIPSFLNNVKIVEPGTQRELTYHQQGEIWMTSPLMILGYFDNERATKETFLADECGQRWIHTGDIGYMDEDGVLFIVDRMKRMIIRPDGHNVWPSQIESVITQHPSVAACAVVGKPNPDGANGQIPTAYIVLKEGDARTNALIQEIDTYSKEHLPERDVALAYYFLDNLPLTPVGKVDYRALEQLAA